MIVLIKKLISGIRKFCVFLFWPQKSDKNRYHTVEVLEPSVIFEAKDGAYKVQRKLSSEFIRSLI